MDRVRFGRALGYGARHAVKTLVATVDAATAEPPAKAAPSPRPQTAPQAQTAARPQAAAAKVAEAVGKSAAQARETQQGVQRGVRRLGQETWRPFVRLSGVLWLELTGVFFGLFAILGLVGVWRLRGEWHQGAAAGDHHGLLGASAMLVVFGYFSVSSFVRARRRQRGGQ